MQNRHGQSYGMNRKIARAALSVGIKTHKALRNLISIAVIMTKGICIGLLAVSCASHQIAGVDDAVQGGIPYRPLSLHESVADRLLTETQSAGTPQRKRANFEWELKSPNAQRVANWVVDVGDNRGMPFVIIDKTDAKVFVFDADGRIRGAAPALLGLARGDGSSSGIGDRKLSDISPDERTISTERASSGWITTLPFPCIGWLRATPMSAAWSGWPPRRRSTTVFPSVASMCQKRSTMTS
jgi:hypothetical protein